MELIRFNPEGTGVAMVTPFSQGTIDYDSLGRIIDHVIGGGVDYLVSLGTTGESNLLSEEEQKEVLRFTVKHTNNRVKIVAGCFGGNDTKALTEKIRRFDLSGISAILSSSPAYIKPTQEGIYQHYSALAHISPLPIILYNVPGRTASNMSAEICLRLARDHASIIGIKDASGDIFQGSMIAKNKPSDYSLLSGDDQTALGLISCGGAGVISVVANAYPGILSQMIKDGLQGRKEKAADAHYRLLNLHPLLYCEGNPAGIKGAMEHLGLCSREVRLPLTALTNETCNRLKIEMGKV
jgi:4-hydroxy-tetrahydrodipicolinate synthase